MKRQEIEAALIRVGVQAGDVLLVHSSLSSFGRVDGGARALIDAVVKVVGADGLVIMPTFTGCRIDPTGKREAEPFDPETTSCRSRTGLVPDTFRCYPGVKRSWHPTHSLAAIGARAEEFVQGGERRVFDPAGPYGRYVRWGGKALFLGAKLGSNTTIHCAEDWMGLPFLTDEEALVRTASGVDTVPLEGSPFGCRSFYGGGGEPARCFHEEGIVRVDHLNAARIVLMEAREIIRVCCENEERQPGFLLCRETPHDFCRDGLQKTMTHRARVLSHIADLRSRGWIPGA